MFEWYPNLCVKYVRFSIRLLSVIICFLHVVKRIFDFDRKTLGSDKRMFWKPSFYLDKSDLLSETGGVAARDMARWEYRMLPWDCPNQTNVYPRKQRHSDECLIRHRFHTKVSDRYLIASDGSILRTIPAKTIEGIRMPSGRPLC